MGNTTCSAPIPSPSSQVGRRKTAPPSTHKPAPGARKQHRRQRPEDGTAQHPQAGARRTETGPLTGCPAGVIHAGRASIRCGLRPPRLLLDGDRGAGALEGRLGLVSGLLVGPLEDRLRSAVHQVLGLLEAEAGQRPDLLDDLDLLVARRLQDDVELVLLLDLGRRRGATAGRRGHGRDRCRGLHVEGLLELLHKVRQLQEGHLLERVEQIAGAQLRHDGQSSVESSVVACGSSACASAPAASASFCVEFSVSDGAGAPSSDVRLASSAAASLAICVGSAAIVATAFAIDAFMAPASIASRTSRDSRSASRSISAGLIDLPSMTPPLISSAGLFLAKSRSPLAASTTSPLTNAIADGPVSRLPSWPATPASVAAIFVRVFLTTANVAWSPSERRSSAICATVSPR